MKTARTLNIALLSASLLIAGCAGSGDKYPSLAVRDVERAQGQFTPTAVEREPIRPVATAADIAGLVRTAEQAHARFLDQQASAMTLVSSASRLGIESNTRQRALVAVADLVSIRSDTAIALADLDLLAAKASTTFAPTDELIAARSKVEALISAQSSTLDALSRQLSQ